MMKSFRLVFAFSFILIVSGQEFSEDVSESNVDEPFYESKSSTAFIQSDLAEDLDENYFKLSSIAVLDDEATNTESKPTLSEGLVDEATYTKSESTLSESLVDEATYTKTDPTLSEGLVDETKHTTNKLRLTEGLFDEASYTKSEPTLSEGLLDEAMPNYVFTTDVLQFKEDLGSSLDNLTFNTSTANSILLDVKDPSEKKKMRFRDMLSIRRNKTLSPEPIELTEEKKHKKTKNTINFDFESQFENQSNTFTFFSDTGLPEKGDIPILNRKVFKGRRVTIGEHPYIVSIRRNYSHFLTGSQLKTNIVITIAHPLFHVPIYELGVVSGESYNERGTSIAIVLLVVIHYKFDRFTLRNDLALLLTYGENNYKFNVRSLKGIYKTKNGSALHKKVAFVTGWGRCDFTGEELCLPRSSVYFPDEISDPMLRSISFTMNSTTFGCKHYHKLGLKPDEKSICIGDSRKDDLMAPCLGVPGAPLVVQGAIAGVLSWGLGCGYASDMPLVYTDIRKYENWINQSVDILETINNTELSQLFTATKAYLLSDLTYSSRNRKPNKPMVFDKPIELNDLDNLLIKLKAKLYDIRDFVDGGKYHESKKLLYRELATKLAVNALDNNTILTDTTDLDLYGDFNYEEVKPNEETVFEHQINEEDNAVVGTFGRSEADLETLLIE